MRAPPGPPVDLIGPTEAARRLGVSTRTVQRWLREGRLPGRRVGARTKVEASALDSLVAEGTSVGGRSTSRRPTSSGSRGPTALRGSIGRLLVANRGELVPRIARSCRRLGITCLALVTDDQARAWWARQADEVVPLGGGYLDAEAVLRAAGQAGADAIHPGYGFMAEDAAFADAVDAAGLVWVGPPADAMRRLGDKASARRLAVRTGVPVLPGYDGADQSDAVLAAEAERIRYPLLLKPSAGGGGKGMHVVRGAAELGESIARARREARGAFGDERLVLERYVERPRHVEVQLLLDRHGGAIHLGERDCSVQRRHQKVVEESPSPAVDDALRERLGEAAVRLARAAGYVGAGTAEFLLDDVGSFHFLEVNARLQVEHPVTELVTRRDLVADQLRIASGEPLGIVQQDVRWHGHAVEARVYAEDPWAGFLPATGTIEDVRWPEAEGVRVDAGVGPGDVVGTRYDPMLAKIVAAGETRDEALARTVAALEATSVLGVTTNRGFLRWVLSTAEMREGDARTDLVERKWHPAASRDVPDEAFVAGAQVLAATAAADDASVLGGRGGAGVPLGFRLNGPRRLRVIVDGTERAVDVRTGDAHVPSALVGPVPRSDVVSEVVLDLDGRAYRVRLAAPPTVEEAARHAHREAAGVQAIRAPMPGTVLAVRVAEGDEVEAGQTLVTLEAMKMENAVTAPSTGTVVRVLVVPGQQVQRGDPLVESG